jgi:putative membrane protein
MTERDFFSDDAKRSSVAAVRRVEAQTSAELVVLAYHFGVGSAAVVVLYLLVAPGLYSVGAIALEGILAFGLGLLVSLNFDTLLRAVSRGATLDANVNRAARAAFFDLGISRTSGRSGILVYVSLFERRCVVLNDIGLDPALLEPGWQSARGELERTVKRRDLPAFHRALESLGPVLGLPYPRSEDDVNELPDEVQ